MQTWDCTIEDDLKELIGTTYTNQMYIFSSSPSLKNSMWVGTKYAEKSHVDLWGQSLILKADRADYRNLGNGY